jgi:hypothetical protein
MPPWLSLPPWLTTSERGVTSCRVAVDLWWDGTLVVIDGELDEFCRLTAPNQHGTARWLPAR